MKSLEKEACFHDMRFAEAKKDVRDKVSKYYSANRGALNYYDKLISICSCQKKVLELGCGTGTSVQRFLQNNAAYTGIDISSCGIRRAVEDMMPAENVEFHVMNAEKLEFHDDTFDLVAGSGILHHLCLQNTYKEMARVVKPDGCVVFMEPLAHNPLINLFRLFTPRLRTADEHPLKMSDIELLRKYFHHVESKSFSLLTIMAVPFNKFFFFKKLLVLLEKCDSLIFKNRVLRKFAWTTVIYARYPYHYKLNSEARQDKNVKYTVVN